MPASDDVVRGDLQIGGLRRTFTLRLPQGRAVADDEPPLVLALHGNHPQVNGQVMRQVTGFDAHADAWGVAVVYPDGHRGSWADGRGVTAAEADGADDIAFLRALVEWSAQRHGTAPDRTIVAGVSNGAFMGHRLALEAGDRVAALAAVAGALPDALRGIRPSHAVAVLMINGSSDKLVPLEGGYSRHRGPNGELRGRILSLPDTIEHWRTVNRCGRGPGSEHVDTTPPSADRPDHLGLTRHTVTGGVGGTRVAAWTVHGGGHAWPGSQPSPETAAAAGPTAQNFDTAEQICRFAVPLLAPAAARRLD